MKTVYGWIGSPPDRDQNLWSLHSLDSEVLCCQPGVVNLQHESGVVLCGDADLKKQNTERQRTLIDI